MNLLHVISFLAAISGPGAPATPCADAPAESIRSYRISNPDHAMRGDAPVVISLGAGDAWVRSVRVLASDGAEIPSQLDDLDGDGRPDELCFVIDLKARESKTIKLLLQASGPGGERYPARVHAQMFLKTPGGLESRRTVDDRHDDGGTGDMYNRLHHHGPAFESELVAYRLYFDKKQTVDLYGKYDKGLELAETMWYPTDEQLAAGAGDDVIRVFGSVGVGTLRGWDAGKRKAATIGPIAHRVARIVAAGPVRTVVDMSVEGWIYQDRWVAMTSRYILYAGHRDCEVQNTLTGGEGLVFCTGVMKMAEHTARIEPGRGIAATWGTDYPVNDTVKYAKQTVGLAVSIDPGRILESCEDKENLLFLLSPDARGRIDYRITFAARKEHFGYRSDEEFYRYVDQWARQTPITIKEL